MKEDKGHSPVGASSRYRYKNCAGSVNLCKTVPPLPSSSYAEEGTKAHEVAAYYFDHHKWPKDADLEMIDHLKVYVDAVLEDKATLDPANPQNLFLVEHGFDLSMIHKDAWGTADCVIYDAKNQLLYVWDLKYGAGILVEAEDNEQLVYYAVGAFLSLDLPCKEVILKIGQPRCEHADGYVREHRFQADKLLEAASDIEAEIKATDDPKAPLSPGKWCRFCPAAGVCPALMKNAMTVAKQIFSPTTQYDPQALADTLDKLPMVEAFAAQVREFAYGEAMKGRLPPGYKLVKKRPTRKWKEGAPIGKFLAKAITDSEALEAAYTQPELKSPAQVAKLLPKDMHKKLSEFVIFESSGNKLVHASEPGEPILLDAKTVFGEIKDEDDCSSFF